MSANHQALGAERVRLTYLCDAIKLRRYCRKSNRSAPKNQLGANMNLLKFKRQSKVVTCERCGQALTDPESIARGLGPECAITATAQFAAVTNLTEAVTTGAYFDQIAQRFLIEKRIIESRLKNAKAEFNPAKIIKFTKELNRVTGILVRREFQRLERQAERQVA